MCGFVGAIGNDATKAIEQNLYLLKRRGPDSSGILTFKNRLTMAASRLAMTDPHKRSNQPMVDSRSENVLLFNGEVYNYELLREKMLRRNISFSTNSDTEVVLKSLTSNGKESISSFEGMFALAFYNKSLNTLTLARDFLGKKPLYYALQRDILIFSSQINFIKKILKKTSLSFTAISNYLALGYLIDPMTMYNEIISVEPGEIIEIDLSDLQIKYKSKFTPDAINYSYGMDIKSTLNEAISERVRGHSRFALSLSGGIDSTILLLQSLNLGYRAEPFTVCWPHADKSKYNLDAKIALQITKKLGIDLNVVEMPDNKYLPALILDYSKAMEEPNSNPSGISMMELYSRIAQSGLRLVLTGDGADEVFGGYHRYTLTKRMELLPKIQSQVLNKIMLGRYPWTKNLSKVTKAFTSDTNQESWLFWHLNAGSYSIKSLCEFLPEFSLNISDGGFSNLFNYSKSSTAETMFKDLNTWIPMESNRKLDRISMWHSVEARSPFQSEKVINTGYTTMDRFRFKYTNKEILRDTYPEISDLIPNQKKMGFISPLGDWLRSNPELIMHSLQILKLTLPLNERELNSLIKSPSEGDFNRFKLLWSLVILGQWIEVNL